MFKPNFRITPQIASALMQIEACRQAIDELPIDATVLRRLRETAALSTTHFSTQIEGNRLTLPEVRAAIKGERMPGRERDEREVRNHFLALKTMEELSEQQGPLSEEHIQRLHGLVMTGRDKPSLYRTNQNVIRDSSTGSIVYLPPEAPDVPALMESLVEWTNAELAEGELPAPIVAALAHYQFATIHPYLDGNGRIGRLLITLLLDDWKLLSAPLLYLSLFFKRHRTEYYRLLSEVRRHGDWEAWTDFFLEGVATIADEAVSTARDVFALVSADRQRVLAASGASVIAVRLLEQLPVHPVVTIPGIVKLLKTTKPTAGKAVQLLESIAVLTETSGKRRDRTFAYKAYLERLRAGTELEER